MKNSTLVALLLVLITIMSASFAEAYTIKLGWDANVEADLAGYNLYHTNTQSVYDMNTPDQVLGDTDVEADTVRGDGFHCWVLTAFDIAGNESDPSNEVCMTLPDDLHLYDHTPPGMPGGFAPIEVLP